MSDPLTSSLAELDFAEAEANLDAVVTQAVAGHRIQLIGCRGGDGRAVLISTSDLEMLLEGVEFHPRVGVSEGEFVIRLPELSLVAGGPTLEAALDEMVTLVEHRARDFFARFDRYRETDQKGQFPFLLRFALADVGRRRSLVGFTKGSEVKAESEAGAT